jgi:hypothetical protein
MPVTNQQQGDTVIYTLSGPFDRECAMQYISLNVEDYNTIGDAMGTVIDYSQMGRFSVSGLRIIQDSIKGVQFDTPVALVGNQDSIIVTFLRGLEALSSRGRSRFGFFSTVEEGLDWIDSWFKANQKDRNALRGQISTKYGLPRS